MGRAVPPLPHTPSWRGAQGEHRDFTFYLYEVNGQPHDPLHIMGVPKFGLSYITIRNVFTYKFFILGAPSGRDAALQTALTLILNSGQDI